jgi:di/tricarboxylate transporter
VAAYGYCNPKTYLNQQSNIRVEKRYYYFRNLALAAISLGLFVDLFGYIIRDNGIPYSGGEPNEAERNLNIITRVSQSMIIITIVLILLKTSKKRREHRNILDKLKQQKVLTFV